MVTTITIQTHDPALLATLQAAPSPGMHFHHEPHALDEASAPAELTLCHSPATAATRAPTWLWPLLRGRDNLLLITHRQPSSDSLQA